MLVARVISSHCLRALCDKDTSLSSPGQRRARSQRVRESCTGGRGGCENAQNAILEPAVPSVSWTSCRCITRGSLILLSAFNEILGHQEDEELFRNPGKERN